MPDRCPDENAFVELLEGRIQPAARRALEHHVDACEICRRTLALVLRREVSPPPDERIGRYFLLEEIGIGGMGRVLRAYDPSLQRELALKVERAKDGERGHARLLREAQAMARLSHPNVVPVYDVCSRGEHVYIAMALVQGCTLTEWLARGRHPWRAVLAVFEQAGRGLVAAHRVGLVHRDFKPDNVLVRDDGRVLVTDFGLASAETWESDRIEDTEDDLRLTRTGVLVGTPAYMAPEQHAEGTVDARTDQYAFCIALYEALVGKRPFTAADIDGLARAKTAAHVLRPSNATAPAWVFRVLARGLRPDPADRWPSMEALLSALERRPRRWIAAAAATLVASGLAVAVLAPSENCTEAAARVDAIWNGTRHASVESVLVTTGPWATLELDRWTSAWRGAYAEACPRAKRDPDAAVELRCLDDRLRQLDAVVSSLELGGADVDRYARDLVSALPPVARCREPAWMAEHAASAGPHEADVLRTRLARVAALRQTGRYRDALAPGEAILADALALGDEHVLAEAELSHGLTLSATGQRTAARDLIQRAYHDAVSAGADEVAGRAAAWSATWTAKDDADPERAAQWIGYAYAAMERRPAPNTEPELLTALSAVAEARGEMQLAILYQRAAVHTRAMFSGLASAQLGDDFAHLAQLHAAAGEDDVAIPLLEEAIAIANEHVGPEHPVLGVLHNNLGVQLRRASRFDEALASFDRAAEVRRPVLGTLDPLVGTIAVNRSATLHMLGRTEEGLVIVEEALATLEALDQPEPYALAEVLVVRGGALEALGRYDEAERDLERALDLFRMHGRDADPTRYPVLVNLGRVALRRGDPERALVLLDDAQALMGTLSIRSNTGELMLSRAEALFALRRFDDALETATRADVAFGGSASGHTRALLWQGRAAIELGAIDEGTASLEASVDVALEAFGPGTALTSAAQVRLAEAYLQQGRAAPAVAALEPAIEYFGTAEPGSSWHARARFLHARATWTLAPDRRHTAFAEAHDAAEALAAADPTAPDVEPMRAWLRQPRF